MPAGDDAGHRRRPRRVVAEVAGAGAYAIGDPDSIGA